jgi:hypothetical protein
MSSQADLLSRNVQPRGDSPFNHAKPGRFTVRSSLAQRIRDSAMFIQAVSLSCHFQLKGFVVLPCLADRFTVRSSPSQRIRHSFILSRQAEFVSGHVQPGGNAVLHLCMPRQSHNIPQTGFCRVNFRNFHPITALPIGLGKPAITGGQLWRSLQTF